MSDWKKDTGIEYVVSNIIKSRILDVAETMRKEGAGKIKSDVTGSYTGSSEDHSPPTQDADDL